MQLVGSRYPGVMRRWTNLDVDLPDRASHYIPHTTSSDISFTNLFLSPVHVADSQRRPPESGAPAHHEWVLHPREKKMLRHNLCGAIVDRWASRDSWVSATPKAINRLPAKALTLILETLILVQKGRASKHHRFFLFAPGSANAFSSAAAQSFQCWFTTLPSVAASDQSLLLLSQ